MLTNGTAKSTGSNKGCELGILPCTTTVLNEQKRNTFGNMSTSNVNYIISDREETYVGHSNGTITTVNNHMADANELIIYYAGAKVPSATILEKSNGKPFVGKMHQTHFYIGLVTAWIECRWYGRQ